ncbi:S4 domain-containing protein YaaA [Salinicoccus hispanicus]|uniref:S4 domain-containing protein YaaA n=1 Tax=Salinicoccus hispanicus TaxID=157225 RepID=A0A6N8U023_9STAP|nr:S4 domain-containing protein YaaA [Salinicoccus hispanicus]MXQ51598.1 S4 domain-containing protein YaaA [Salinicoccus hispanicus]
MESIRFDELITLGKFLKHEGIIGSGGEAKWFLQENEVLLNGEPENRRGKKLHEDDVLDLGEFGQFRIEYSK